MTNQYSKIKADKFKLNQGTHLRTNNESTNHEISDTI